MSNTKPHKQLILDAHMIGLFRDCEEKYHKRIVQYLTSKHRNGAPESGIAFHDGAATFRMGLKGGMSVEQCYNIGLFKLREAYNASMPPEFLSDPCPDERRSLPNLERIFEAWCKYEHQRALEYLYIEQSFGIYLGTIEMDDCIWEVIYAGIVDALVKQQGLLLVDVIKTTTMNITQNLKDGYKLSQAFPGYIRGAKEVCGIDIYGAEASLVWFQKEAKSGKGKPLDEYFTVGGPYTYTPEQDQEWLDNTILTAKKILHAMYSGEWQMARGTACTNYNGCTFKEICWSRPNVRSVIENMDFERMTWTPLEEIRSRKVGMEE